MCDELKTTSSAAETQAANIQSPVTGPSFVGVVHMSCEGSAHDQRADGGRRLALVPGVGGGRARRSCP